MIYKVKARVIDETIGEFYRKLADGTGNGLVISLRRSSITPKRATTSLAASVDPTDARKRTFRQGIVWSVNRGDRRLLALFVAGFRRGEVGRRRFVDTLADGK